MCDIFRLAMDSSDIIRKRQAQTVYGFYKATVFSSSGLNTVTAATAGPPSTLTFANHGLSVGDAIVFGSIGTGVTWSSTPAVDTLYYIVAVTTNTFQFSATFGGSALTWTGTFTTGRFPTFYGPNACITRSEGCKDLTPCVTTFPSYELRQQFITGSQACNSCSNTGCGCA
jgi:hypothetical protein